MHLLGAVVAWASEPPPIVNGDVTDDFPEVVYLELMTSAGAGGCSGSLISAEWVLTAAHCVDDVERVTVSVGTNTNGGLEQDVEADEWTAHPRYSALYYDIALVHLSEPFTDVPFMAVVDEPLTGADLGVDFRMVGWGRTSDEDESLSRRKRTVEVPLEEYEETLLYTYDVAPNGGNACYGDSGGPVLRQYEDGRYAIAGVMDAIWYSTDCVGGGLASARVDYFRDWIDARAETWTLDELEELEAVFVSPAPTTPEGDLEIAAEPARPVELGEDYRSACAAVATAPSFFLAVAAGLLARRRAR